MNNYLVSESYSQAVAEVLTILDRLPKNEIDKIPHKLLNFFKTVSAKDYKPNLDYSKDLNNIELKEKTKDILSMLYRNYWCTEEERKEYDILLEENEKKYQEDTRIKYNPDNIFEHQLKVETEADTNLPTNIKNKEKIYTKVINFLKRIFHKKEKM